MRWLNGSLTACSVAVALALVGCGGDDEGSRAVAPGPRIDSAVAEQLASRADEVARRLESADPCGAAVEAAQLRRDLTTAINDRAVPEEYLEDLSNVVNELGEQIPTCAPPTVDSGKEKDKGDGDGEEGDD